MYEYVVRDEFTLDGVDYKRGDVLSGSAAEKVETHPALLKRCSRRFALAKA